MSLSFTSLKRFLVRLMIYQVILLWTYVRFTNIEKHCEEIQKRLNRTFSYFDLKGDIITELIKDPSIVLMVSCFAEAIFGLLGLFGNFYGNLFSAFLFSFVSFGIYFFPLLPENAISLYNTRLETVMNLGILLSLLLITFYPYKEETEYINYKSVDHVVLEGLPRNPNLPTKERKGKSKKH